MTIIEIAVELGIDKNQVVYQLDKYVLYGRRIRKSEKGA